MHYNEAIRLKPDFADAFNNRAIARRAKGDAEGELEDYKEAIRLKPDFALALYNRAKLYKKSAHNTAAIADLRRYLDVGGGLRDTRSFGDSCHLC